MKKKKVWIPLILGLVFLAGLCIALYQPIKQHYLIPHHIEHENHKVLKQSSKDIHKNKKNKDLKYSYDSQNVQRLGQHQANHIDPRYMNGVIIAPSVDMKLPILEGISNTNLNYGAGTMKPHQVMGQGNYALAGHHTYNESALFTPLMHLPQKSNVYLTDKDKVYAYQTYQKVVVDKSRGDVVNDVKGHRLLTLVTCTDVQGTKRLVIRGKLKHVYKMNDAPQHVVQQINN